MGPDSISALYDSLTSQSKRSSVTAVLQYFYSVRAAARNTSLVSVTNSLRGIDRNDNVNWGQIVFLTTCVIAMTGCGLLSSLLKRKLSRSNGSRAQRPGVLKSATRSSKTLSSSEDEDYEDEDYDSKTSLRRGTNPDYKAKDLSSETQQQSSDGTWPAYL
jgi:hypothetical protein